MRLSNQTFALVFTLLYAALLAVLMQYHELWFDETEPWLLALYSNSYADLLYNKRFEGHPNLWYSVLFLITKLTSNLKALQVTQAFFAVGFVYVFLRHAPFSRIVKLLICFGYYGLFEYGVISRLYAVELLVLFLVCTLYPKRFTHWYLYVLLLALLAQTNLFGFFLAGALGLLLFSEAFRLWKKIPSLTPIPSLHKGLGILLWASGCSIALWSMVRPNEAMGSPISFFHPYYFYQSAARLWQSFAPVPQFEISFWNSSFLSTRLEILLSVLLAALIFLALYRTKQLLLPLLLLYIILFLFFALKMEGNMRHHGHFFFYTIAFLWLAEYYQKGSSATEENPAKINWYRIVTGPVLLVFGTLQVMAGAYALYTDWHYPFYPGKAVAAFIKTVPPNAIIATDDLVTASNIAAYAGHPLLHLPTGNRRSFYTLDPNESNGLSPYVLLDWALALAQRENAPVIFVCRYELPYQWHTSAVKFIKMYKGEYIETFSFYVYQIDPLPLPKKDFVAGYPVYLEP